MTLTDTTGFAYPEVMIAAAIFSAGVLAVAKLGSTTDAHVTAMEARQTRLHQLESLALSVSRKASTPASVNAQLATLPDVTVVFNAPDFSPAPAPLFSAQLMIAAPQDVRYRQTVLIPTQPSGQWQDVTALYRQE